MYFVALIIVLRIYIGLVYKNDDDVPSKAQCHKHGKTYRDKRRMRWLPDIFVLQPIRTELLYKFNVKKYAVSKKTFATSTDFKDKNYLKAAVLLLCYILYKLYRE